VLLLNSVCSFVGCDDTHELSLVGASEGPMLVSCG